jgi:UDP-GlcNAc:undecaprenyl-phosphate GlcNAc-1-phosphate transferase
MIVIFIVTIGIAFFAALVLTPLVRILAIRIGAVDKPGGRKIHTMPMPRLGGLGVVLAGLVSVAVILSIGQLMNGGVGVRFHKWLPILSGAGIIFIAGVWDDIRSLPAGIKFLFQAAAACVAIYYGVRVEHISFLGNSEFHLGIVAFPLTFIWIVGITNAFNLVDGLDGLATGLAIIASGSLALLFFIIGDVHHTFIVLILCGALLGFLPYNFNPATIFLGDSGSMFLGYMLAVSAISGSQKSVTTLAVVIPLLVFGLPIVDTLLSMIRRLVASLRLLRSSKAHLKERLVSAKAMFVADQRHIHHRLLALGFSHRGAVLLLYTVALSLSFLAFLSVLSKYRNAGVILIAVGTATFVGVNKLGYDEVKFLRLFPFLRWWEQVKFNRGFLFGCVDVVLVSLAYWGAFFLKYDNVWTMELLTWYLWAFPIKMVIQLVIFYALGLYQAIWGGAGVHDFCRATMVVLTAVIFAYIIVLLSDPPPGTTSFFYIDALLTMTSIVGVRVLYRLLDALPQHENVKGHAALIYGAGQEGQLILRALLHDPHFDIHPVGFLDDNPQLHGRIVQHTPVIGSVDDLQSIVVHQPISSLIISNQKIDSHRLHQVMGFCEEQGISLIQGRLQLETLNGKSVLDSTS